MLGQLHIAWPCSKRLHNPKLDLPVVAADVSRHLHLCRYKYIFIQCAMHTVCAVPILTGRKQTMKQPINLVAVIQAEGRQANKLGPFCFFMAGKLCMLGDACCVLSCMSPLCLFACLLACLIA